MIETMREQVGEAVQRIKDAEGPAPTCLRCVALQGERDLSEATLAMTVARLGGIVEGLPTGRHNFLQRIDQLTAAEALRDHLIVERDQLKEENQQLRKELATRMDRQT